MVARKTLESANILRQNEISSWHLVRILHPSSANIIKRETLSSAFHHSRYQFQTSEWGVDTHHRGVTSYESLLHPDPRTSLCCKSMSLFLSGWLLLAFSRFQAFETGHKHKALFYGRDIEIGDKALLTSFCVSTYAFHKLYLGSS